MNKYCVNCKHFSPAQRDDDSHQYAKCARTASISLVTGTTNRAQLTYCTIERGSAVLSKCGPEGQFFEESTNV